MHQNGLRFDRPVAPNGYSWWYIDALSHDGTHGLTTIAFIGSVFSPYYAWARRSGLTDPLNHCAFNVALYESRASRWAMTERGVAQVERQASALSIGSSTMRWSGGSLEISLDEICTPLPHRLRGLIRLTPNVLCDRSFALDKEGLHRWTPYAPCAHVEVRLDKPSLNWSGTGYLDSNSGDQPLEDGFEEWTWSRASLRDSTVVFYDTKPRDEEPRSLALQFVGDQPAQAIELPRQTQLPTTRWRLPRQTRTALGQQARVIKTLEDAPFYSRSLLETHLLGSAAPAIHEKLSLDRFRSRWVQCLLPFRMPRIAF